MPLSRDDWACAYARQGASDFQVYNELARGHIPVCHRLHYLQMACEKLAKARLFLDKSVPEAALRTSHIALVKFVDAYYSSPQLRQAYREKNAQLTGVRKKVRNIAREIEKLAPAVDQVRSPSNAEYPWESGARLIVPCDYDYPNLSSLLEPKARGVGVELLKIIQDTIRRFGASPSL